MLGERERRKARGKERRRAGIWMARVPSPALGVIILLGTACASSLEPGPPLVAGTWLLTAEWEDVAAQDSITWSATLFLRQNRDSLSGSYTDLSVTHCPQSSGPGAAGCSTHTPECWWEVCGSAEGKANADGTVSFSLITTSTFLRASGTLRGDSMMGTAWIGREVGSWRAFRTSQLPSR